MPRFILGAIVPLAMLFLRYSSEVSLLTAAHFPEFLNVLIGKFNQQYRREKLLLSTLTNEITIQKQIRKTC